MTAKRRVAVLVSGSGTNLQALINACQKPDFPAEIVLVISNRANAYALTRAAEAGIATHIIPNREYASREAYDAALQDALVAAGIDIVCLAGFMRILTAGFVSQWEGRMLNIHPSLLPLFKGLHTHAQALEAKVRQAGCTVHFVEADLDAGPIILQAAVPVLPDDTAETLAARVLVEEHKIYPQALRWLAEGRIALHGRKVLMDGKVIPASGVTL